MMFGFSLKHGFWVHFWNKRDFLSPVMFFEGLGSPARSTVELRKIMKNDLLQLSKRRLGGIGLFGQAGKQSWMLVISLITLVSWLVATNHCAIEGQLGRSVALIGTNISGSGGCSHCAENPLPPGEEMPHSPPASMECCKSLQALAAKATTDVPAFDIGAFVLQSYIADRKLEKGSQTRPATNLQSDTGPPKVRSFAEMVLQHCILSHAPPRLA